MAAAAAGTASPIATVESEHELKVTHCADSTGISGSCDGADGHDNPGERKSAAELAAAADALVEL